MKITNHFHLLVNKTSLRQDNLQTHLSSSVNSRICHGRKIESPSGAHSAARLFAQGKVASAGA